MARKKTAKRAATKATLPKGFEPIGGFGLSWPNDDTKIGEAIQGEVTDYKYDIKTQHGKTDNMTIETKEGTVFTVWNSAGMKQFFDEDYTGIQVWLRFDGLGKKKGKRNPPKLFTTAYKE